MSMQRQEAILIYEQCQSCIKELTKSLIVIESNVDAKVFSENKIIICRNYNESG